MRSFTPRRAAFSVVSHSGLNSACQLRCVFCKCSLGWVRQRTDLTIAAAHAAIVRTLSTDRHSDSTKQHATHHDTDKIDQAA
jgi:wyosine [tRNA(Phe)-imidazoG37] synthetase (radical SAM superfamily)